MSEKSAREAAATLLRFAKSTSNPNLAAALVNKAADLKERAEYMPPQRLSGIAAETLSMHERSGVKAEPK